MAPTEHEWMIWAKKFTAKLESLGNIVEQSTGINARLEVCEQKVAGLITSNELLDITNIEMMRYKIRELESNKTAQDRASEKKSNELQAKLLRMGTDITSRLRLLETQNHELRKKILDLENERELYRLSKEISHRLENKILELENNRVIRDRQSELDSKKTKDAAINAARGLQQDVKTLEQPKRASKTVEEEDRSENPGGTKAHVASLVHKANVDWQTTAGSQTLSQTTPVVDGFRPSANHRHNLPGPRSYKRGIWQGSMSPEEYLAAGRTFFRSALEQVEADIVKLYMNGMNANDQRVRLTDFLNSSGWMWKNVELGSRRPISRKRAKFVKEDEMGFTFEDEI